jgi:putative membrane protein
MTYGNGIMNGWGVMGPLAWIFMLLLWGFAVFGLVWAVRLLFPGSETGEENKDRETPLEILKARYARGEIDKEEFERIKKDLQ